MSVYSYQCRKCSHHFTKLYSQDDSQGLYCPSCGSTEVNLQANRSFSNYITSYLENSHSS